MNRRIIEDDEDLPHFARASQNIAAMVALLRGLLKPATLEKIARPIVRSTRGSSAWRCSKWKARYLGDASLTLASAHL
jgi:hypothetical protein